MKNLFLFTIVWGLSNLAHAQHLHNIVFPDDETIILKVRDFCSNEIEWQESEDGFTWTTITQFEGNEISVDLNEYSFENKLLRGKVTYSQNNTSRYTYPFSVNSLTSFDEIQIGDYYQGSHIFLKKDSLLISGQFSRRALKWGCEDILIQNTNTQLWTGAENTISILNQCQGSSAASFVHNLEFNGFNDWYLPSSEELEELIVTSIESIPDYFGNNVFFWSSTEGSSPLQERAKARFYTGISTYQLKSIDGQIPLARNIRILDDKSNIAETFITAPLINEDVTIIPSGSFTTVVEYALDYIPEDALCQWDIIGDSASTIMKTGPKLNLTYNSGGYKQMTLFYELNNCYSPLYKIESLIDLFSDLELPLPESYKGEINSIDINNDGKSDIFLTGDDDATTLYQNDSLNFEYINNSIVSLSDSYSSWGDFENDGRSDIAICGYSDSLQRAISHIYINQQDGSFSLADFELTGVSAGFIEWIDFNNDGRSDIILSGMRSDSTEVTELYANIDGVLTRQENDIPQLRNSSIAIDDYDRDGWQDILINGINGDTRFTGLFNNDDGGFNLADTSFIQSSSGGLGFADFDSDGNLDIIVTGQREDIKVDTFPQALSVDVRDAATTAFYSQSNAGQFTYVGEFGGTFKYVNSGLDIADFDSDGFDDIVITGLPGLSWFSWFVGVPLTTYNDKSFPRIMKNLDDFRFASMDANLPARYSVFPFVNWFSTYSQVIHGIFECSSTKFADINGDNKLDVIREGRKENRTSAVLINTTHMSNQSPSIPSELSEVVECNMVTLSWSEAIDDLTLPMNCWYEVFIKSLDTGKYLLSDKPNRRWRSNLATIQNIPPGEYSWAVRAVDNSRNKSNFSSKRSFVIETNETPTLEQIGDQICANIPALEYSWYLNENLIEGEMGECLSPTISGNYSCIAITETCESDTSNSISFISTNVVEDNISETITVFPMPSKGIFHINSNKIFSRMEILDSKGTSILNCAFKNTLDLTGIAKGIYILILDDTVSRPLIVN